MIGLKVPKKNADNIRRTLLKESVVDLDWKIKRSGEFVFIPIVEIPKSQLMDLIGEKVCCNLEVVETEFESQRRDPKSFTDYLKG
ncbi:MAG: class I SAM-dependent methyltransferase family protein, partial [Methanobacterium aggregans]